MLVKKKCSNCRRSKDLKSYSKNASMPDGLDHYCKVCNSKRMQAYFQTKKGKAAMKRATIKRKKASAARASQIRKKKKK